MADNLLPGDQWALPLTAGQQLTSPELDLPLPPRNTPPSIPILTQDTDLTSDQGLPLNLPTYSGFRGGLQRGGPTNADCVEHELRWQGSIEGDADKARHFKDHILQDQLFRPFALIRPHQAHITICHSIGKYYAPPGKDNQQLHGKTMAFIGDRTNTRDPVAVTLDDNVWTWDTPVVYVDPSLLEEFYQDDANATTLFSVTVAPPTSKAPSKKGQKKSKIYPK